jgi:hypothetical protein
MQKLMLATEAGPAYLSWVPGFTSGFSRVRVTRSLALCVCFVDRRLSFCSFSFGHCVVCPSYINKKPTDNDLHNTTEKTKDLATGIQQKKI